MHSTIVYLIGYPGVGKLTIAKALCQLTGAKLVDNHMANNPIFSIIDADGNTRIPEAAWDRVKAIRDVLFDTILHVAPRTFSYVLTNVLLDDDGDRALFEQVRELAAQRASLFVPVVLHCEKREHLKRVAAPGRAEHYKDAQPSSLEKLMQEQPILPIVHPHLLALDTTSLSPQEAANTILSHIDHIARN
jgi:adenylate kinase family enzyme